MITSIHSLAGGVGKTTLALEMAEEPNSILIDCNFIGCGLGNLFEPNKYLNDIFFASKDFGKINDFIHEDNFLISNPSLAAINEVVPLLATEEMLGFFSSRITKLINQLSNDYENIIIDNHPGFFGISVGVYKAVEKYKDSESIMIADCNHYCEGFENLTIIDQRF